VRFAPSGDPLLGGHPPEHDSRYLGELIEAVRAPSGAGAPGSGGIVFDGDGDRNRRPLMTGPLLAAPSCFMPR